MVPLSLRQAVRRLLRSPWRTVAIVGTLALAIGVGTTMFVVADALLFRSIPFPNAHELAVLSMRTERVGTSTVAQPIFAAWKRIDTFDGVEAANTEKGLVETDGGEAVLTVARVSPGLLTLVGGVRPTLGRLITPTDGDREVLISETVWRTLCASDPDIIGRSMRIDRDVVVVIGVLPATFLFPSRTTAVWRATDFTSPQAVTRRPLVYVRLPSDGRRARALDSATVVARSLAPQYSERWRAQAEPLAEYLSDPFDRRAVPLLIAGVVLLCLVLTTNATGLMLLSVSARRREIAIRRALGAPGRRMLADSASDVFLLCLGSVASGLLIALWLVGLSRTLLDNTALMRGLSVIEVGWRATGIAVALGVAVCLTVGLSAWFASRLGGGGGDVMYLRTAGAVGRERTWSSRARLLLVVGQVSLSAFLGFTALLLVRSFLSLSTIDPGFNPNGMQIATVRFPATAFPSDTARWEATRRLRAEAEAIPGIRGAAWSYGTPPGGGITDTGLWTPVDGGAPARVMAAHRFFVDSDFFTTYDLEILAGRSFLPTDDAMATLVSERLAAALWPGGSAVGRRFRFEGVERQVIGVVEETRWPSLDELTDSPQYYVRMVTPGAMLTMACAGACPSEALLRRRLNALGLAIQLESIHSPGTLYQRELARPVAMATFGLLVSAVALCAGAAGLFGLLAQFVADRRREFAVRICLGASRAALRSLVWRQALSVVIPGLLVGGIGAQWASRMLAGLFVDGAPVTVWLVLSSVVTLVVIGAAWAPLRAAMRVAPIELLRE